MKFSEQKKLLASAVNTARAAGDLMRRHQHKAKRVHEVSRYDIRLKLDIRCQKLIEKILRSAFPDIPVLGEEGVLGDMEAAQRWVVDPIDGTVNFARGIPHACVSIALQVRPRWGGRPREPDSNSAHRSRVCSLHHEDIYETIIGVVYDPFCDELWTAIRGQPARLNGRVVKVSQCRQLSEAIVMIGFAKSKATMELMLPVFNRLAWQTHKVRITGAAALALTYVASGRFDAYVEAGIHLWDIAAGGLILECAGGQFIAEPTDSEHCFRMLASNGKLRPRLEMPDYTQRHK